MATAKRNYRKEYDTYHSRPDQIKARAQRNAARKKLGLAVGDPREADHKNPISKGGSNRKDNLRAVSRSTNRRKGAK
jgi:5-methylcytosine-specific restriction endonuclease McrA